MTDPYSEILEIPKRFRPPTYYQLLMIAPSEMDRQKIQEAAERQLRRIEHYRTVATRAACELLAQEVIQARDTILDPVARSRYDVITPDAATPWWKAEPEQTESAAQQGSSAAWWQDLSAAATEPKRPARTTRPKPAPPAPPPIPVPRNSATKRKKPEST